MVCDSRKTDAACLLALKASCSNTLANILLNYFCAPAEDFFKPRLEQAGYTGLFWPKACSPAEQYGFPCDGCALFYRTERFDTIGAPCGESRPQHSVLYLLFSVALLLSSTGEAY
jgi:hypothetical protein